MLIDVIRVGPNGKCIQTTHSDICSTQAIIGFVRFESICCTLKYNGNSLPWQYPVRKNTVQVCREFSCKGDAKIRFSPIFSASGEGGCGDVASDGSCRELIFRLTGCYCNDLIGSLFRQPVHGPTRARYVGCVKLDIEKPVKARMTTCLLSVGWHQFVSAAPSSLPSRYQYLKFDSFRDTRTSYDSKHARILSNRRRICSAVRDHQPSSNPLF